MSLTFSPGLDDIPSLAAGARRAPRASVRAMISAAIGDVAKAIGKVIGRSNAPASHRVAAPAIDATLIAAGRRSIALPASAMTLQQQWTRAVRPLEAATETARTVTSLHESAGRQLDSVDYALQQLLDDLSAVMPVQRAPRASIHHLQAGPAIGSATERSLAA